MRCSLLARRGQVQLRGGELRKAAVESRGEAQWRLRRVRGRLGDHHIDARPHPRSPVAAGASAKSGAECGLTCRRPRFAMTGARGCRRRPCLQAARRGRVLRQHLRLRRVFPKEHAVNLVFTAKMCVATILSECRLDLSMVRAQFNLGSPHCSRQVCTVLHSGKEAAWSDVLSARILNLLYRFYRGN
jgi:hypothetical protein